MEREIGDGIRAFHDLSSLNLAGRGRQSFGASQNGSAAASGSSSEEVAE